MRPARHLVPLLATLALLATACGGGEAGSDDASGSASGSASASTTAPSDSVTPEASASETAAAGAMAPDGEFPRTVVHHQGETEIPAQPERVVVLDTGELDSVTVLGIEPVGAVRAPVESGFLEYLSDETADTELVGTIAEPDLEAIAGLDPDLILSSTLRHEQLYDQLSAIAPTVFTETVGVVWKDNLIVHADALGMPEQAQQMLADYEDRASALGDELASDGELPTISMVRFLPGSTRLYQKASFIGTVLEDVGFPRPESQDVEDFALEVSPEQVDLMAGDVILHSTYGAADESTQPEIVGSELWNNLEAVQEGRVHEVSDDHWMLGIGITAANLVLDDIEALPLG